MKYRVKYQDKCFVYKDKLELVKKFIPKIKRIEDTDNFTIKQRRIYNLALKGDTFVLTDGCYSAKDIVEICGGKIV